MNLKPFRDINEHEVVTLFSTVEGDLSKGTVLQLVSFNPDNHSGWTNQISSPANPLGVYSANYEVLAKVRAAQSSTGILGIALCDVVSSNPNVWTIADQRRYFDKIPSGKAVPILKRGMVEIAGHSGVCYPGAIGYVPVGGTGQLAVGVPGTGAGGAAPIQKVGTFLSVTGADGYAIFQVDCI